MVMDGWVVVVMLATVFEMMVLLSGGGGGLTMTILVVRQLVAVVRLWSQVLVVVTNDLVKV